MRPKKCFFQSFWPPLSFKVKQRYFSNFLSPPHFYPPKIGIFNGLQPLVLFGWDQKSNFSNAFPRCTFWTKRSLFFASALFESKSAELYRSLFIPADWRLLECFTHVCHASETLQKSFDHFEAEISQTQVSLLCSPPKKCSKTRLFCSVFPFFFRFRDVQSPNCLLRSQ